VEGGSEQVEIGSGTQFFMQMMFKTSRTQVVVTRGHLPWEPSIA
jgi:hypothetical protein